MPSSQSSVEAGANQRAGQVAQAPECWVRSNRRLAVLALAPLIVAIAVAALLAGLLPLAAWPRWTIAGATLALGLFWSAVCARWLLAPRLTFAQGKLWVLLRLAGADAAPLDGVECFFLGQSATLPKPGDSAGAVTQNIVIRLAEQARDWSDRPTHPWLGRWRGGYIILHGGWCEPITPELLRGLNRRLVEVQRAANAHPKAASDIREPPSATASRETQPREGPPCASAPPPEAL